MRIALISCTSSKMDYSCRAAEMYSASPRFSLAYKYAKKVADVVYIISAKHGLLAEEDVIAPYNESLIHKSRDERKQWSIKVLHALGEKHSLESDVFVVLAGRVYNEYLIPEFKHYELPLEGLSMGWWIPKLRDLIGEDGHESAPKPIRKELNKLVTKGSTNDIRNFIREIIEESKEEGHSHVDIVSGDIHKQMNLDSKMPSVCSVMYQLMGEKDIVLQTTPSGKSSTIKIRYFV